jgi:hypothetical protein
LLAVPFTLDFRWTMDMQKRLAKKRDAADPNDRTGAATSACGTKRTLILRSVTSVIGGKADLTIARAQVCFLTRLEHRSFV